MIFRFGRFELSDELYELRCDGRAVPVEKKAIDIILTLIKDRDRVVSRRELLASVWAGVSVGPRAVDTAVYEARKALGDDPESPEMIKTVRGRGYRWLAAIIESDAFGGGPGTGTTSVVPFVGRRPEIARFENAIADASVRGGSCFALLGEPGVGKSRLLHEFEAIASRLDVVVARSQCSPMPDLPALWPVRQALAALDVSESPTLGKMGSRYPELNVLLDDCLDDDGVTARATEDLRASQFQMFGALASYIGRSDSPVVVLVDDVQWADRTSLQVLQLLAEQVRRLPLVLVVAAQGNFSSDAREAFDFLLAAATWTSTLEPLTQSETRLYLERAWHRDPTPEEVSRFEALTGGNPLFLSLTFSCSSLDFPDTIRAAALRYAQHLDDRTFEAVQSCTVAGTRLDIGVLAEALDVDPGDLLRELSPAVSAGVLQSEGLRSLAFRHSLVRDALYEKLPITRRSELHADLGLALLGRIRSGRTELCGEAGFHLATCGDADLKNMAFFCLGVAASSAFHGLALQEAVERSEIALSIADDVSDEMICNVLIVRGSALAALGMDSANDDLRRALSIAIRLDRPDLAAKVAFAVAPGLLSVQAGVWDPVAAGLLEDVLRILPDSSGDMKPLVQARLAQSLYWGPGTEQKRADLASAALSGVAAAESQSHVGIVRAFATAAVYSPDTLRARLTLPRPMLREDATALEVDTAFLSSMIRIASLLEAGDTDAVDLEVGWFGAALQRWPTTPAKWYLGLYDAMLLLQRGELDRSLEAVRRAGLLGTSVSDANAGLAVGAIALSVRYLKGEFRGLDDLVADFVQKFPRIPHWQGPQVLFRLKSGDSKAARSLARIAMTEVRYWPINATWPAGVSLLAEAVAELGVEGWIRELLEVLAPYEGRLCVVGYGVSTWGSIARILGRLRLGLRDPSGAIAHFESAIEFETRARLRPWRALTMASLAMALRARGAPGDSARADRTLQEAETLSEELSMSLAAARWTGGS